MFDHTKHLPVKCKRVTGNVNKETKKPVRSQTKCDLHNYLGDCPTCNANLCIDCYKLFHEEPDIVGKKKSLKRKLGIKD